jgi:hypothetical protein
LFAIKKNIRKCSIYFENFFLHKRVGDSSVLARAAASSHWAADQLNTRLDHVELEEWDGWIGNLIKYSFKIYFLIC